MKTTLENQITPIATPFSQQNTLPNLWHYNTEGHISDLPTMDQSSSAMQCFSSPKFNSIYNNNLLENQNLCNNNEGAPNFNLSSLLSSTPSSSSPISTLNSSTYFFLTLNFFILFLTYFIHVFYCHPPYFLFISFFSPNGHP